MNQQHNITNLYDAQLSQQVDYCMNAAAAYYCQYLTPDDPHLFQRGVQRQRKWELGRDIFSGELMTLRLDHE
jgi:hypothetical protein